MAMISTTNRDPLTGYTDRTDGPVQLTTIRMPLSRGIFVGDGEILMTRIGLEMGRWGMRGWCIGVKRLGDDLGRVNIDIIDQ